MSGEKMRNEVQLTKKKVDAATSLFVEETTISMKSDVDSMEDLLVKAKVMYDDISGRKEMVRK